jgi:hypothetical protein
MGSAFGVREPNATCLRIFTVATGR